MTFIIKETLSHIRPSPKERPIQKKFRIYYWDKPQRLDENSKVYLYDLLKRLASKVFGDDMSPYWKKKEEDGFLDHVKRICLVVDPQGEIIGWTGYFREVIEGQQCLYWDATGILPEFQKQGVMNQVISYHVIHEWVSLGLRPFYIIGRSESPIVYYGSYKWMGGKNIYPSLKGEVPKLIQDLAKGVALRLDQLEKLEPESLRIVNAFNGPCPWRFSADFEPLQCANLKSRDERINSFFSEHLKPEDTFLIVARVTLARVADALWRQFKWKLQWRNV